MVKTSGVRIKNVWYNIPMKTFFEEFKAFAMKGNVLDLAVAVVLGAAFGKVVTSVVEDLITPLIGMLGHFDFGTLTLGQIKLGAFLNSVLNFFIIALSIFMVVKALNKMTKKNTTGSPTTQA